LNQPRPDERGEIGRDPRREEVSWFSWEAGITNHGIRQPPVEKRRAAENFAPIERRTIANSADGILPGVLLYGHTTSKSRPVCGKTAAKSSHTV
jgi:hypothetical protein